MSDLLKEAIADAKAVRETALQNAKMALEEAFTPRLKSMLSAKLKEDEMDDEEGDSAEEMSDEIPDDIPEEEPEVSPEEGSYDEMSYEADEEPEIGDEGEDEVEEEGVIEINGVKYAPVVQEDEFFEEEDKDDDDVEENLDLEAVIKELEDELSEGEDDDEDTVDEDHVKGDGHTESPSGTVEKEEFSEAKEDDDDDKVDDDIEIDESALTEEDDDDDKEEVDEQSTSSGIGSGNNSVKVASSSDEEDPGKNEDKPGNAKAYSESVSSMKAELKEYKEAVSFLKDKLHEVNILNAKLLFTNKLFREFALDNSQKVKVVETFDRAQTTREIKLVYSTLAEQFQGGGFVKSKKSISESASSKSGSTKPSEKAQKVISEEAKVASRFKELAGLLKN